MCREVVQSEAAEEPGRPSAARDKATQAGALSPPTSALMIAEARAGVKGNLLSELVRLREELVAISEIAKLFERLEPATQVALLAGLTRMATGKPTKGECTHGRR